MKEYKIAYAKVNNAGDLFNEALMDYFGVPFKKTDIIDASLVMLGGQLSTLILSEQLKLRIKQQVRCLMCDTDLPLHIWGTGFLIGDVHGRYLRKNLAVHALRGELTKAKLAEEIGYKGSPVLADPGLMACEFVKHSITVSHCIGFIPHFRELNLPVVKEIRDKWPELYFIDITQPYGKVLEDIKSCELIISSSLHGLIFADSLGVPNKHIVLSDKIKGDGFKFRDYYSSFGVEDEPFVIQNTEIPKEQEIYDSYKIEPKSVNAKVQGLIDSFPKDL